MKYISVQTFFDFIKNIWRNKFVIYQLTKRDYKNRYLGSFLGFVWTIIQPLVMIFVLWFVFTKAFGNGPVQEIPFMAWLTMGLVPWYFFSEAILTGTSALQEYSYIVKKMQFQTAILPIIKLFSSFITHIIFMIIGIIILTISNVDFSFWWFQMFYYLAGMTIMLLGLCWITASLQVFIKDIAQIINVILQFGFWLTPIMWNPQILPQEYEFLFKFNPMFYIVDGYRNSFLYHVPFWTNADITIYFWAGTIATLIIGATLFRKLKPHFADVL